MRSYFRKDLRPKISSFTYPIKNFVGFDGNTNQDLLPLSNCVFGYNVRVKNGKIKQGLGIENAKVGDRLFPSTLSLGSYYHKGCIFRHYNYQSDERDDIFVALLKDKKLYYLHLKNMTYVYSGIQLNTLNVTFLNYHTLDKDLFLILTDTDTSYCFDGTEFSSFSCPKSIHACVHNSRIFSVNGEANRLSYSKELAPLNWNVSPSEGGNITFADEGGALQGVISWKNAVYIFRDFAIHKLNAYVDQSDFSMTKLYSTSSKIFFKSVAVCNDYMIFLSDDGFYTFDGYTVKKILQGLFPFIGERNSCHAIYFDNTYHIAVDLKRDDEEVGDEWSGDTDRNGVISYNVINGEVGILRGADIGQFVPFYKEGNSQLFFLFGSTYRGRLVGTFAENGKIITQSLKKLWRSPYTDLGDLAKIKVLKKIFLRTKEDITMSLILDKKYDIDINGGPEAKMIPLNKHAERIGYELKTEEDFLSVDGILFEFDFVRRLPNE